MPMPAQLPPLRPGRVHEVEGPSAHAFAVILCAAQQAGALWVRPGWSHEQLMPQGLAQLLPPDRLLIAQAGSETDILAVAEEALRDGALPTVVIQIGRPLSLRAGRRLQLAAGRGGTTGLCLIPQGAGSPAAETRWRCTPVPDPDARGDSTLMQWALIKNKSGTTGAWHVRWNRKTHRLDVVSPARFGPGAAALPD